MENIQKIIGNYEIGIDITPNDQDIAIIPVNDIGEPEEENRFVLSQYGYTINDLPDLWDLNNGFSRTSEINEKKQIYFVLRSETTDGVESFRFNLYNALIRYSRELTEKKIWIPLTGTGKLPLDKTFNIIAEEINRAERYHPTNNKYVISVPNTKDGKKFMDLLLDDSPATKEVEELLYKLNCNFYLVGSFWGPGNEQTARFVQDSIWEKGHEDDSYAEIINKVEKNDILIIKSTFASEGISYLKVKAIGIVTHNPLDGSSLEVNWKVNGLWEDVAHLGFFRNTITKAEFGDIITIFSTINFELWKGILSDDNSTSTTTTTTTTQQPPVSIKIAGLLSDSDKGTDHLNISRDVSAFARVIASRDFEPPLAVGLLGKWGSGKSFFMRKLMENISSLSEITYYTEYCKGIAHIHFNAWSYMDANLWASIVTKIFDGLNEYISRYSKSDIEKKAIQDKLSQELSIVKEEVSNLETLKKTLDIQIEELDTKKKEAGKNLSASIKKLKNNTLWDTLKNIDTQFEARNKIISACQENASFIKTEDELKKIIPEQYWSDPNATYEKIKSRYTFLKLFFKRDKIWYNLMWLIIILAGIYYSIILVDFAVIKISRFSFILSQGTLSILASLGIIWKNAENVFKQLQPVVSSFWKIKEDYQSALNNAKSKFEQEQKVIQTEIETRRQKIITLDEQIKKAQIVKVDLEYKIKHALATESLYSFIDRRSKSDDYRKHLGIISIIRKDFEILNDLFIGHNQENQIAEETGEKDFKSNFKKPLERIILYIDDLDRCSEETVVEVLEAVNLLMAFPLFVVVVGVDSRWVKNALKKRHALQFGKEYGVEMLEPSDYLEKIFQIPFQLKEADGQDVKDMIRKIANIPHSRKTDHNINDDDHNGEGEYENAQNQERPIIVSKNSNFTVEDELVLNVIENTELQVLTEDEVEIMQHMSLIIGNNPRAIKRYVNIFKIVKAHGELLHSTGAKNQELSIILFLLALPLGNFRKLAPSIEKFIYKNNDQTIKAYLLHQIGLDEDLVELRDRFKALIIHNIDYSLILSSPFDLFKKHIKFLKRFSFDSI